MANGGRINDRGAGERNGRIKVPDGQLAGIVAEADEKLVGVGGAGHGGKRQPGGIEQGVGRAIGSDELGCKGSAFGIAEPGDSGAGVFEQVGENEIALVGILWGGGTLDGAPVFIFSAMEQIEQELGQLSTSNFDLLASAP